jgi:hypothetical protein
MIPSLPQMVANFSKPIRAGSTVLRELVKEYELVLGLKPTIKDDLAPEVANAMRERIGHAKAKAAADRHQQNVRQITANVLGMISTAPTLTRAEFNSLPPAARLKFSQSGGKIGPQSDNKTFAEFMPPVLSRSAFNKLTPAKRLAHVKGGGKLID